jgi:hypothetical protein
VRDLRPLGMGLDIYVLPAPLAGGAPMWEAGPAESAGDYWALGGSPPPHLPAPAARRPPDGPWVVCPGTPQGRGLEASQLGAKGCVVVEVEDGQIADVAPVAVDHVRFVALEVDVSRCADLAAIRRRLARDLDDAAKQAARPLVAEAVLRGRLAGGLSRDRMRLEAELLSALRGGAAALAGTAASPGAVRASGGSGVVGAGARSQRARRAPRHDAAVGSAPHPRRARRSAERAAAGQPIPGPDVCPLLRQWDAETDLAAQRELVRAATALALDALGAEGRR